MIVIVNIYKFKLTFVNFVIAGDLSLTEIIAQSH